MKTLDPGGRRRADEAPAVLARDADGPVFRELWEAQAFAIVQALRRRGTFSASEWTAALALEIERAQAAGDPGLGDTYYHHWLAALEQIVVAKGITTEAALELPENALAPSWKSLREVGNLSAASVLCVLEDYLANHRGAPGTYSVLAAMGPGFCSELVLLKW